MPDFALPLAAVVIMVTIGIYAASQLRKIYNAARRNESKNPQI